MGITELLDRIRTKPDSVEFNEVMQTIGDNYDYQPMKFINGAVINEAGENEGSCKIFAFAKMHGLDEEQTLNCFGNYFREDVLKDPDGESHANIRSFMAHGWAGIQFEGEVLKVKV